MAEEKLTKKIDEIAGRYVSDITPGFSILLSKDGVPCVRSAYGMADIKQGIFIRPEDHFIIASNTKQFTCLAILMLRERGLIDLDEPIDRFFPDFPDYRKKITVRMLMNHTSGIKEYFEDDFLDAHEDELRTADAEELIRLAKDYRETAFEGDTAFSYCNTGYVMLGNIIQQLSGKKFGRFLKEEIFDILEMDDTIAPDYMDEKDPKQVKGYISREGEGAERESFTDADDFIELPYDMMEVGYADGNISTNVDDILKWHGYLYDKNDDRLVPYKKRKEMWTTHLLKDGTPTNYGMGIMTGDLDSDHRTFSDRPELWHTGGTSGFISRISYFPDERISAIILTNWNGIERDSLFRDMMNAFFETE